MTLRIVAILVSHRPDPGLLAEALRALAPQVGGLVVIDNGSDPASQKMTQSLLDRLDMAQPPQFLPQSRNLGLGMAQNLGLAEAHAMRAEAVLFLDQDSVAAPNMVARLGAGLQKLTHQGNRPAAIGPIHADPNRPAPPPFSAAADAPETPIAVPTVIASGALIPIDAFDAIGPFDEALFVDFVDTEWCFRAAAAGYGIYGAPGARMAHRIGDRSLRFAGRNMAVHSPERGYFQIRNALALRRRAHVPRRWLWRQIVYLLGRGLILTTLAPPRLRRAQFGLKGLWHGLRGRLGPLPQTSPTVHSQNTG